MPYLSLLICIDFKSVIAARTASATYETICKDAPQRKNCTAGVFWSKVGISFFSIIIVIEEEEQQGHYLDRGGRPSTIHLRSMTRRGNNFSAGYVLSVCSMNHKVATHQQETVHSFALHLGKGPATKLDEFLEKFQTAFAPPSFLENYIWLHEVG